MNITSTKLVKRLGVPPDIEHKKEYSTAGPHNTTSQGAYLALLLRFSSIAVANPDVVLPNQKYDFLIDKTFLKKYDVQTWHDNSIFYILGQQLCLSYSQGTLDPPEPLSRFVNLAFADKIILVKINTLSCNYKNISSQIFKN